MQAGSRKTINECTPTEWYEATRKHWDEGTTVFVPNAISPAKWKINKEYVDTFGHSDFKEVEHPIHYVEDRKYEPWDVVEDWKLNYFAGTALKYISRYERKGEPVRDLKKAIEFLKREIVRLEKEKTNV